MIDVAVSVGVGVSGSEIRCAELCADRSSWIEIQTHQDMTIGNDTFRAAQEDQMKIAYAYAHAYAYDTEGDS